MSSTLMWEPVVDRGKSLSYEMKRTISRYLWATDGSIGGGRATMNANNLEFLRGLELAGGNEIAKDARTLIEAIEKYGAVDLWHEH